jgi:hypothetical protein
MADHKSINPQQRSGERWVDVRLVIHRGTSDRGWWAVLTRYGRGAFKWDRRVASGELRLEPGSPESAEVAAALTAAAKQYQELQGR